MDTNDAPLLGLRTVIYPAPDLAATKAAFTAALGIEPYFDQPFYVGYEVGGYELGLDPSADPDGGVVAFWGVAGIDAAVARLVAGGAEVRSPANEVGEGIKVATLALAGGALLGLIENPHFVAGPRPDPLDGAGR
jgi:predicted enzyme related to lactoylglutathione lyase